MKTRKIDRVVCEYFGFGSKVGAVVGIYRVDRFSCTDHTHYYVTYSWSRLAMLSRVANMTCSDVAAMPNGWTAFRV